MPPINTAFTLNRKSPQANGLVAWVPLAPNTPAREYVNGLPQQATYSGIGIRSDDTFGSSLDFPGANTGYLQFPLSAISGNPHTLSAWINSDNVTDATHMICQIGNATNNVCALITMTTPTLAAVVGPGGVNGSGVSISTGTWWHFVAVCQSTTLRNLYVNGFFRVQHTTSISIAVPTRIVIGKQYDTQNRYPFNGLIRDVRVYNKALTAAEVWQMYAPQTRFDLYNPVLPKMYWQLGIPAETGSAQLTIQSSTHSHTADNLTLVTAGSLEISSASHAHSAENISLSQAHILVVQSGTHGHTADNIALTQDHVLVVQSASHTHSVDNVTLVYHYTLVAQDSTHGHTADSIVLTQVHALVVQDSTHAQYADNVVLVADQYIWPFSDDFTGADDSVWSASKWVTEYA